MTINDHTDPPDHPIFIWPIQPIMPIVVNPIVFDPTPFDLTLLHTATVMPV